MRLRSEACAGLVPLGAVSGPPAGVFLQRRSRRSVSVAHPARVGRVIGERGWEARRHEGSVGTRAALAREGEWRGGKS